MVCGVPMVINANFVFLEGMLKMSVLAVPISQSFEVDKNKVKDFDNQSLHTKQWILDRLSKYNKNEITWD